MVTRLNQGFIIFPKKLAAKPNIKFEPSFFNCLRCQEAAQNHPAKAGSSEILLKITLENHTFL